MTLAEQQFLLTVGFVTIAITLIYVVIFDNLEARRLEREQREARHMLLWGRLCDALVSLGDKQSATVMEATKRIEEAYFGKRSEETVIAREFKRYRRVMGLPGVTLGPGESKPMQMQPQQMFEILEVYLESDRMADVVVDDVKCGKDSQFLNGCGGCGGHTILASYLSGRQGLKWDKLYVNITFTVLVRNVGKSPLIVRGAVLGDAIN